MDLPSYNCVLCQGNITEAIQHHLMRCPFSKLCWNLINLQISDDLSGYYNLAQKSDGQPFFLEITVLMAWSIWITRNGIIFDNQDASIQRCTDNIRKEFALVIHQTKKKYHPNIDLWASSLL
uniref:Reverse transcriptase zinc-binding domain-containing protein n=1 Tax=Setaria viridis TaxID=4556 RepID=A0A4U6VXF1_SETVI|nr:hypothetical protein SEVIR_2G243800v2 [Setaria viridis]